MVLKEIAFLRKHTRASDQRIFGSYHGADVCLRPVKSPGAENLWLQQIALIDGVSQALCGKVYRSSTRCRQRPQLPGIGWPGKNWRVKRWERSPEFGREIFRKKCNKTLAYAQMSASIYSGPPPPRGTAKRPVRNPLADRAKSATFLKVATDADANCDVFR